MTNIPRILAVFAHPDDEIGAGGALAKYAHQDADVTLVCATRGEAATIYCQECALPETLAAVRTQELECSCLQLGIGRLQWLDWPDGAVQSVAIEQALEQLVPLIRKLRPHILLTHAAHGGYPHPDHIGVYERVLAAFHAAGDPSYQGGITNPWQIPKCYARAIPEEMFDLIPGFRDYRIKLNGQSLPFQIDPPEHIHCTVDCTDSVDYRIAAWACHQSQHNPNGTFSTMPAEVQRQIFRIEHFHLLAHNLADEPPTHDSLLTGLYDLSHDKY